MAYKKVGWKDYPSTDTPINATNLDHMDAGISENAQTIGDKTKISGIGDGTVAGAIAANKSAIDANTEAIAQNTQSLTDSIPQILTKCEEIKSAVDAISSTSLPNPLSLQVNGNISQKINYPFGSGTMEANATCTFPLSAFWTLGYKKCSVNGKEYNTSTANVSLSMGDCRKGDGIAGSTSGKQSNTLVFSY